VGGSGGLLKVRLLRSGIYGMYGVADGEGFFLVHRLHIDTSFPFYLWSITCLPVFVILKDLDKREQLDFSRCTYCTRYV